jgi:hypothetical protein
MAALSSSDLLAVGPGDGVASPKRQVRAQQRRATPLRVVLVREAPRSLEETDVERVVRAPVVATVEVDPRIATATDAGLLSVRVSRSCAEP